MNRREFVTLSVAGGLAAHAMADDTDSLDSPKARFGSLRELFPQLERVVHLNAAAGTPLGDFAAEGLRRYENYWRFGSGDGRRDYVDEMLAEIRGVFARMIGARPAEIGLVHCTKAGEQLVLDGLPALRNGGNVVTNDLHFAGSLHNYVGLRRAGMDVRIVRAKDWGVDLDAMAAAIDERTALVSVALVSNVNGHVEPLPEIAEIAHARGAYVYADIIQAAGIYPMDMRALGVDFAACSGYKWLFGPRGVGFFFVREELQGSVLADRLFPGHAERNYPPWVGDTDAEQGEFDYEAPSDARRYEPGNVSYLGYCALYEGLKLLESVGVDAALAHSLRLTRRLKERVDPERYPCISPHVDRSPIITFTVDDPAKLKERLRAANVAVTLAGNRLRVSPALYNRDADVDLLAEVLSRA